MTNLTRRTFVKGGTAIAATSALTGRALLEWAKAWSQAAPWQPEKGRPAFPAALETFCASGRR